MARWFDEQYTDSDRSWHIGDLIGLGYLALDAKLNRILRNEKRLMATIQEILDDENTETGDLAQLVDVVNSQQATIAAQAQTIADLQAQQGNLTPEQQATLDAVNAAQKANEQTITSLLPPA